MPIAHVKWFVEDPERFDLDWSLLLGRYTLLAVALAAVGVPALTWAGRQVDQERLTRWLRKTLRPYLPLILSVHLAISLASYALSGRYLAPSLALPQGTVGTVLAAVQLAIAVLLAVGLATRAAAALLVLSGPIGALFYGVLPIVERLELLGIALYLALLGRRRFSVDAVLRRRPDMALDMNPAAVGMLRLFAGLAIAVTALTEKLLAPTMATTFLDRQQSFNLLAVFGVSDRAFVGIAGAIELALGLLLAIGIGTRLLVLIAVVPFNLTLLALGWTELVGHLPIYGIFLVLLVEGAGRATDARSWRAAERRVLPPAGTKAAVP